MYRIYSDYLKTKYGICFQHVQKKNADAQLKTNLLFCFHVVIIRDLPRQVNAEAKTLQFVHGCKKSA